MGLKCEVNRKLLFENKIVKKEIRFWFFLFEE